MMDKLRNCWRSATIWFNGLMLAALPLVQLAHDNLPEVGQYLSPDVFKIVGLVVVVINIALRFRTSKSLADK